MMDFSEDVQTRIVEALVRLGISEDTAKMVGVEVVCGIGQRYGGERVYVGKKERERAELRNEVRRRFNGRNVREIARELGVGRATVYRYLKAPGQTSG